MVPIFGQVFTSGVSQNYINPNEYCNPNKDLVTKLLVHCSMHAQQKKK